MVDKNEYERLKEKWLKEENAKRREKQREDFKKLSVFILSLLSVVLFLSGVMFRNYFLKDGGILVLQLAFVSFLTDFILD